MSAKIIAILDTPEEATAALSALRREGLPQRAITMMSSEPVHRGLDDDQTTSYIGAFAIAGGLIGAACAILLTVITSRRVGLVTGGMPVVTPWAFGIIVFELTALGAILATLARMIIEARLARRRALTDYDEAVANGKVVVAVDCSDDARTEAAKEILGDRVRRVDSN
jgi:membrane protein implicated in regulation of membrane protease activity